MGLQDDFNDSVWNHVFIEKETVQAVCLFKHDTD